MNGTTLGDRLRNEEYQVSTWDEVRSKVRSVEDGLFERIARGKEEVGSDYFCIQTLNTF